MFSLIEPHVLIKSQNLSNIVSLKEMEEMIHNCLMSILVDKIARDSILL